MTSRVRCSCGRVYDPAKHTTCPDCGAESAVESVVVAEKIKPPVPPDLNRESDRSGNKDATQTIQKTEGRLQLADMLKTLRWPVYAGAAAFVVVILFFLLRPHHAEQLVKKDDVSSPLVPKEESPIPTVAISPSAAPTIPAERPQDVSPTPASSAAPSLAPDDSQLDPRLIGAWETKGPWPPNSGRIQTVHWTIEPNGHFSFSGPWTDAGAIAASNGKMKWFSNNNTGQPVDLTYEFNGDSLWTHGPLGDALWWRAKSSGQHSRRPTERDKTKTYTTPDDAVKREILKKVLHRFP
jgi:hypothetical protein